MYIWDGYIDTLVLKLLRMWDILLSHTQRGVGQKVLVDGMET